MSDDIDSRCGFYSDVNVAVWFAKYIRYIEVCDVQQSDDQFNGIWYQYV